MRVAGIVARVVMAKCLDLGVRTASHTACGAVSGLDHLPAGVDATNNTAHGERIAFGRVGGLVEAEWLARDRLIVVKSRGKSARRAVDRRVPGLAEKCKGRRGAWLLAVETRRSLGRKRW